MKVTRIKSFQVGDEGARGYFIVKVETDEGIYGIGESGLTGKELAVQGVIEHFRPMLIGEDPSRIEFIWQRLYRGGFFKGGKISPN